MNKRIVYTSLLVILLLITTMTFAYAYFNSIVESNEKENIVETGILSIHYHDGQEIYINNMYPGNSITKTFKVENTGTLDTEYNIYWKELANTVEREELTYKLILNEEETTGIVPLESENIKINIPIKSKEIHEYKLVITFIETNEPQDYNQGKSFSATINISESKPIRGSLISVITKDNEILDDTSINFGSVSSAVNGQGLYRTSNLKRTEDMDGDGEGEEVLYFRGAVENNYIVFADFCWRIVRTNENGSVKLRYGGEVTSNEEGYTCPETGTIVRINNSAYMFNSTNSSSKYLGYMYDTNTSSRAKTTIDTWYENNIANKEEKITSLIIDTPYCNDMSVVSTSGSYIFYGAYGRLNGTTKAPQYKCPRANDKYTVSTDNGNGKLTYPIGLLTMDEVAYAGGVWNQRNANSYLNIGSNYWTMSPCYFNWGYAYEYRVISGGDIGNCFVNGNNENNGLLPVISLKQESIISNGTGLYNDPYIIE